MKGKDVRERKENRQHGLWSSPISPGSLAGDVRLTDVRWTPDGGALVWREERSGVGVLVLAGDGDAPRELTEATSVRARVGYAGGDFGLSNDAVFFAEQQSGRLFRLSLSAGSPSPVTPAFGFAAAPAVSRDGRWVVYVHTYEGTDRLAIVDSEGREWPRILASGDDFYMQPVWSPDGRRVAWVSWDHPLMPWDGSRLTVAELEPGDGGMPRVASETVVAGGDDVAVFQPEFTADGSAIAYVSDESGWGALVVHDLASGERRTVAVEGGDFGTPAWIQGLRTYALTPDSGRALATVSRQGSVVAMLADVDRGAAEPVAELGDYSFVAQPDVSAATGEVAAICASATVPPRVVVARDGAARVVRRSTAERLPASALSTPEPYTWTSPDGKAVHGLFFAPASERFESSGVPPLVVHVHGGPTSQVVATYNAQAQFLATRGYAVLSVNHRGSSGYGRDYMMSLRGNWGILDVEDSVSGAEALARDGRVDAERMAIMGGSAGGFTVLQTMIVHPEAFAAGVCLYGVSNQFTLAAETHKFEAHYTESLIGRLPEAASLYRERSPQFRASEIRRPIAIFQGATDEVVPKAQSDAIVAALERSGTPHEYHVYEGEGHGWRRAATVEAFYTALDRFLKQYLVFS